MVVVRESPRAKHSPDNSSAQWPPKSPFQALLSSPSGRKKWQDHRNARDRSLSPSPRKTLGPAAEIEVRDFADDGDEEDEETLQLQLQAIQAKLKLKKIQQQKLRNEGSGSSEKENGSRSASKPHSSPAKSASDRLSSRPRSTEDYVQVPTSPSKDRVTHPADPVSPVRKRLGLTANPRAEDVSLKRARDGSHIQRTEYLRQAQTELDTPKLSFSERLNRSRAEAQDKHAKDERIQQARNKGFQSTATYPDVDSATFSSTPRRSISPPKRPSSAHQLQSPPKSVQTATIARSQSTRSSRAEARNIPHANGLFAHIPEGSQEVAAEKRSAGFDDFSKVHLSKRQMPHVEVARAMEGKEIYPLPRLLKEVKAPDYDPPDCEADFVVLAILASKSSPFDQKSNHRTSDNNKPQEDADGPRNKFMVLHLCDGAKWELDCFLFGSAFERFWKLTPGTLLAILNPGVMPPKGNKNNGMFSLKLGSSEDCVLEIGIARDLGYCSSVKKDGTVCGEWVDKRKTTICEFHLNLEIDRNRRGRMEVNTMWHRTRGTDNKAGYKTSRGREKGGWDKEMDKTKHVSYHHEYGKLYSMPPSASGMLGRSTAKLLDAEDSAEAIFGLSKEEQSRKRIAEAQKERELSKNLAKIGNGSVGKEYLKTREKSVKTDTTTRTRASEEESEKPYFEKPSAASLGLLSNRAENSRLSPAKDRRRHFGLGAIGTSGTDAMGWGGARKAGLLQPKESCMGSPERGQTKLSADSDAGRPGIVRGRSAEGDGRLSPKKRARFALEKGIREPGRESLPGQSVFNDLDDDDDGLDIV